MMRMMLTVLGVWSMGTQMVACGGSSTGAPNPRGDAALAATKEGGVSGQVDGDTGLVTSADDPGMASALEATQRAVTRVELTHDVVCPWCRIGHVRLERAAAALGRPVEIVYRPFLLEPDMPPEGADLRARLAAKYGASRLEAMFARVTQIGASEGIVFDFGKVRRSPSSVSAHVLIEAAPAAARMAFLDRVHAAYFERGEDIGDALVLERLWVESGLPADAARAALGDPERRLRVQADALAVSRSGVRGVPQIRIGDQTLDGAQPYEVLLEAMRAAR